MKKILAAIMTSLCLVTAHAWEPDRNKPIKLVMATTPGSSSDIVTRATGKSLIDAGYAVTYEYKTGVGGILAANTVHESAADGHTLLSVLATGMFVTPDLYYPNARRYDWEKFELVTMLSRNPSILIGRADIAEDTVSKIVEQFRNNSNKKYSVGHGPGGGLAQVENFLAATKYSKEKDIVRVPYKGPSEAVHDVAGGSLDYAVVVMPSPVGLIEAGKVKAIAVTSSSRLKKLPNVPTVGETIKNFNLTGINGLALPAGTKKEVVDFYVTFLRKGMMGEEYQTVLSNAFLTLDNDDYGPRAFKDAVKTSINDTLPILKSVGVEPKK